MRLLLFGECARIAGAREVTVRIMRPVSLKRILAGNPALSGLLRSRRAFRAAINGRFRGLGAVVQRGDEVALMSPFSGG